MYKLRKRFTCPACGNNQFTMDVRKKAIYAVCCECQAVYNMVLRIRVK